jgi:hypothetical protein
MFYVKRWFRNNFGGQYCKKAIKFPLLYKASFLVCDTDMTDIKRTKEDRFTMILVPIVSILFVIPWGWWLLKHMCSFICWCCSWEVYVEEEEEEAKKTN